MDYYLISLLALVGLIGICSQVVIVLCIIRLTCSTKRQRKHSRKQYDSHGETKTRRKAIKQLAGRSQEISMENTCINSHYQEVTSSEYHQGRDGDRNTGMTVGRFDCLKAGMSKQNELHVEQHGIEMQVVQHHSSKLELYENTNQIKGESTTQIDACTTEGKQATGKNNDSGCGQDRTDAASPQQIQVRAQVHERVHTYETIDSDNQEMEEYSYVTTSEAIYSNILHRKVVQLTPESTKQPEITVECVDIHSGIEIAKNASYLATMVEVEAMGDGSSEVGGPLGPLPITANQSYGSYCGEEGPVNEEERCLGDKEGKTENESSTRQELSVVGPDTCGYDEQGKFYYDC